MARLFTGANDMLAKIGKLKTLMASDDPGTFMAALRQVAEQEATECKKRCPVWNSDRDVPANVVPGALRASIHVEGPFREGKKVWAAIVAGGPTVDYALTVHEDLEAFHKVGEAKYIERPLQESAPYMAERLAARIKL